MESPANGTPIHSHPSVSSDNEWTTIFEDVAGRVPFQAIRAEIYRRVKEAGFAEQAARDLAMAVHEVVVNAATHGSPSRRRTWWASSTACAAASSNAASPTATSPGSSPGRARPAASRPALGFFLIRTFVNEVVLTKDSGRSELRLRRKIPR